MPLSNRALEPESVTRADSATFALHLASTEIQALLDSGVVISESQYQAIIDGYRQIEERCRKLNGGRSISGRPAAVRFDPDRFSDLGIVMKRHPAKFWKQLRVLSRVVMGEAEVARAAYAERKQWERARMVRYVVACNLIEIGIIAMMSHLVPYLGNVAPAMKRITEALTIKTGPVLVVG